MAHPNHRRSGNLFRPDELSRDHHQQGHSSRDSSKLVGQVHDGRVAKNRPSSQKASQQAYQKLAAALSGNDMASVLGQAESDHSQDQPSPVNHQPTPGTGPGNPRDFKPGRFIYDIVSHCSRIITMRKTIHKEFGLTLETEPDVGSTEGLVRSGRTQVLRALQVLLTGLEDDVANAVRVRKEDYNHYFKAQDTIDELRAGNDSFMSARKVEVEAHNEYLSKKVVLLEKMVDDIQNQDDKAGITKLEMIIQNLEPSREDFQAREHGLIAKIDELTAKIRQLQQENESLKAEDARKSRDREAVLREVQLGIVNNRFTRGVSRGMTRLLQRFASGR
ncbi:hypothetical protein F4779DRAFT_624080 [Xylariaceae sp. FL0662B]|nr:hypothetical protein F4779DRAFT_624080 [Xylariaceae sp. FL0662B]